MNDAPEVASSTSTSAYGVLHPSPTSLSERPWTRSWSEWAYAHIIGSKVWTQLFAAFVLRKTYHHIATSDAGLFSAAVGVFSASSVMDFSWYH